MKNRITIISISLLAFSLTTFAYINSANEKSVNLKNEKTSGEFSLNPLKEILSLRADDFIYNVDSRFIARITKEKLQSAKLIKDLVPEGATEGRDAFRQVKIRAFFENGEKAVLGINDVLTDNQRALLNSIDYSTNFCIEAFCNYMNPNTGKKEDYCFVYYITVVPEEVAEYEAGNDVLLEYLRLNSAKEAKMANDSGQVKPGRIFFTVTKEGNVQDVELDASSGHTSVDIKMIELITNLPNQWKPAMNSNGEKIDQQFVFFYGKQGC